ncbi:hypothetical protein QBC34DRAFT_418196 [Podospora aff. communis PSN243]|uniref:Uncharacterized protein n=1 Tax=Podospora aff. communis PSN243 TaxID=3040156 RepID=A0AAV9G5J8_9PEZI|nr:hypothetical protein QBC34DRAFT_418196 [Podospora aff. communis PSN243]
MPHKKGLPEIHHPAISSGIISPSSAFAVSLLPSSFNSCSATSTIHPNKEREPPGLSTPKAGIRDQIMRRDHRLNVTLLGPRRNRKCSGGSLSGPGVHVVGQIHVLEHDPLATGDELSPLCLVHLALQRIEVRRPRRSGEGLIHRNRGRGLLVNLRLGISSFLSSAACGRGPGGVNVGRGVNIGATVPVKHNAGIGVLVWGVVVFKLRVKHKNGGPTRIGVVVWAGLLGRSGKSASRDRIAAIGGLLLRVGRSSIRLDAQAKQNLHVQPRRNCRLLALLEYALHARLEIRLVPLRLLLRRNTLGATSSSCEESGSTSSTKRQRSATRKGAG